LRRYETIFIVPPDVAEDEVNGLLEKYEGIITTLKGTLIKRENWGKRKLAYEIKKQTKGIYILLDFAGKSAIVDELQRNMRLDDKVLKYMTVMKDESVAPQELAREIAAAHPEKKDESSSGAKAAATAAEPSIQKASASATPAAPETVAEGGNK